MNNHRKVYTSDTTSLVGKKVPMSSPTMDSLAALLKRIAHDRDEDAFSTLFSHFAPKVRAYGLKHLRADGQAMELVQETMMLIWRKAHLFNDDKGSASTWVFTIMRNASFDMLRKVKSNKEDNLSSDIWPLFESQTEVHEESAAQDEIEKKLLNFIELLPDSQQQVIRGVYLKQLTHQEIADQLHVPLGTIKSRLRLGLQKLRSHMEVIDGN